MWIQIQPQAQCCDSLQTQTHTARSIHLPRLQTSFQRPHLQGQPLKIRSWHLKGPYSFKTLHLAKMMTITLTEILSLIIYNFCSCLQMLMLSSGNIKACTTAWFVDINPTAVTMLSLITNSNMHRKCHPLAKFAIKCFETLFSGITTLNKFMAFQRVWWKLVSHSIFLEPLLSLQLHTVRSICYD